MVKTYDEPTVGQLGSAINVQDPSTGRTRPPYRKHSTTLQFTLLQGLPKAGTLQLVYHKEETKIAHCGHIQSRTRAV